MLIPLVVSPLLKLIYSSLLAGIGVTVVFSTAILGFTRANEMRRENRSAAATLYGVMAAVGLLLSLGVVVYGLYLVAHKS
jgi:hypothetical protein